MSENSITLSQFFNVKDRAAKKAAKLLKSEKLQNIKQKIADKAGGVTLPSSFYENLFTIAIEKLDEVLQIDIAKDIFATAWSKHQALLEYYDREKYPPDQSFLVPLGEHSLKSEHAPTVEPSINGNSIGSLEFQLEANFTIEGAVLEIRDAKIMKICLANIKGTGTLGMMGITFIEKEHEIKLPGTLDLGEGVPIPRPFQQQDATETTQDSNLQDNTSAATTD